MSEKKSIDTAEIIINVIVFSSIMAIKISIIVMPFENFEFIIVRNAKPQYINTAEMISCRETLVWIKHLLNNIMNIKGIILVICSTLGSQSLFKLKPVTYILWNNELKTIHSHNFFLEGNISPFESVEYK